MEARRYRYMLKLRDGRLLYIEATSMEDARRKLRLRPEQVKRAMPVHALPTQAETSTTQECIAKLKERLEENT